jgi:hypothetical protein
VANVALFLFIAAATCAVFAFLSVAYCLSEWRITDRMGYRTVCIESYCCRLSRFANLEGTNQTAQGDERHRHHDGEKGAFREPSTVVRRPEPLAQH